MPPFAFSTDRRHVPLLVDTTTPELLDLLAADDLPRGEFLVEEVGARRLWWRISEGAPTDETIDPAPGWTLLPV